MLKLKLGGFEVAYGQRSKGQVAQGSPSVGQMALLTVNGQGLLPVQDGRCHVAASVRLVALLVDDGGFQDRVARLLGGAQRNQKRLACALLSAESGKSKKDL